MENLSSFQDANSFKKMLNNYRIIYGKICIKMNIKMRLQFQPKGGGPDSCIVCWLIWVRSFLTRIIVFIITLWSMQEVLSSLNSIVFRRKFGANIFGYINYNKILEICKDEKKHLMYSN